jgi:hypothetical protein
MRLIARLCRLITWFWRLIVGTRWKVAFSRMGRQEGWSETLHRGPMHRKQMGISQRQLVGP